MVELVEWKWRMAAESKEPTPRAAAGFATDKRGKAVVEAEQSSNEVPEERKAG